MVPLVSILIVNYHAYDELDECLASIAHAADRAVETIVVDNASAPAKLASVRARHAGVRFVPRSENTGFAGGVNEAARHGTGDYFLLLNPDTTLSAGAVTRMRDFLLDQPAVAAVGARVYDADGTVQRSARAFPTLLTAFFGRTSLLTSLWPGNRFSRAQLVADESTAAPTDVDWVAGSCVMFRADAFRAVGGMDEGFFLYWEDADLCCRLRAAGWRIAYLPDASVVHHVGRSSRHARVRSIVAFHKSAVRYYRKHRQGVGGFVAVPLATIGLYTRMVFKIIGAYMRRMLAASVA
jgi:N-acetylglucosaminyl-diphospho-decaprenol L-rhamnosyltransferase